MNVIVEMKFGSHLYGTNTSDSDTDYKGVFMPSREQVLLGKIPKSINIKTKKDETAKNTAEDIDTEIYSLHHFIHLACEGETVALDMLHAPGEMIQKSSFLWGKIVLERHRFYTKNLKAFVGYARRQASKYGIKGSRLNDAQRVLDFIAPRNLDPLSVKVGRDKLSYYWDELPTGEHIFKRPPNENGVRMYEVCGRKIGETSSFAYAYDIVKRFCDNYGERARQAANNEGIDWKAVSHAIRAALQVKEILLYNTIVFPLREAQLIKSVKNGELDFQKVVGPLLDDLITEIEELSAKSTLPERVDRKYWDKLIVEEVGNVVNL